MLTINIKYQILLLLSILHFSTKLAFAIEVSIPDTTGFVQGQNIQIPINTDDVTGQNVFSYYTNILFDSDVLTCTGITTVGTISSLWPSPVYNAGVSGQVNIAGFGVNPMVGSGVVIYINFLVVGNNLEYTPIDFDYFEYNEGTPSTSLINGYLFIGTPIPITVDTILCVSNTLCLGDSMQLFPQVSGGIGNFSYSWTSSPTGFYSQVAEPYISPENTTTYTVEVSDTQNTASSSKLITVIPVSVLEFTGLTSTYCSSDSYSILQGNIAPDGAFSGDGIIDNGDGTANFDPQLAGVGVHQVTYSFINIGGCTSDTTMNTDVLQAPVVNIGSDTVITLQVNYLLDAGSGYQSYLWSDGSTNQSTTVYNTDNYWVEVTNSVQCTNRDTTLIYFANWGTWLGKNNNWSDPENWGSGFVPDLDIEVIIPTNPLYGDIYPEIFTNDSTFCRSLFLEVGSVLNIPSGKVFIIRY